MRRCQRCGLQFSVHEDENHPFLVQCPKSNDHLRGAGIEGFSGES